MKDKILENLFSRLELECSSYLKDLLLKSKEEIVGLSCKTTFVLEVESFVRDKNNISHMEGYLNLLSKVNNITLDAVYKYYSTSEGYHFDSRDCLIELMRIYCFSCSSAVASVAGASS